MAAQPRDATADLAAELDSIIDDAPLDFLGTGGDSRRANKCEREWDTRVARFRQRVVDLQARAQAAEQRLAAVQDVLANGPWDGEAALSQIEKIVGDPTP